MLYCSTDFIVYGYTCTLGNWCILKIFRTFLDAQPVANDRAIDTVELYTIGILDKASALGRCLSISLIIISAY